MQLRAARDLAALEQLLDQIDAAARPVELIAQHLIGGAGRVAEAAVHALAQDRLGLLAVGRALELRRSAWFAWLLVKGPHTGGPGLRIRSGSKAVFSARWMRMSSPLSGANAPALLSAARTSVA